MELNPRHVMVVLSGGQDSTTCLGIALNEYERVSCVTFDYGQRHKIELQAAANVVAFFRHATKREIHHEYVYLGSDVFKSTSPLTDPSEQLETYSDHAEMEAIIGNRVEKTFVPTRNAAFLTIAANRAVARGANVLMTGVCQADNANYPDCRESFILAMEEAINQALGVNDFTIATPLMHLTKADSIALAYSVPHTYDALAFSHTAYDGKYPPTSKDHASVLRAYGFEQAGLPDPLVVRAWREGLMPLPLSDNYETLRTSRTTNVR